MSVANRTVGASAARRIKPGRVQRPHSHIVRYRAATGTRAVSSSSSGVVADEPSFIKLRGCLVYPPSKLPLAVIHFIGGAFIGAAPDVFYSYLLELLVGAGFLVIATPYSVSFDHRSCVSFIQSELMAAVGALEAKGLPSASLEPGAITKLPLFGVGHSNGALLHVLMGTVPPSSASITPKGNVIISYNNKPASDAVPFFDQVGPAVVQLSPLVQSFPLTGISLALAEQLLESVERTARDLPLAVAPEILDPAARFGSQILPVLAQVRNGVSEFTPTPRENQTAIATSYAVPSNLLIQFSVDSIDETPALDALLRDRARQLAEQQRQQAPPAAADEGKKGQGLQSLTVETALLSGTHATPLAPDVRWPVGQAFSPSDAAAMALKSLALADIRRLARTISQWILPQL